MLVKPELKQGFAKLLIVLPSAPLAQNPCSSDTSGERYPTIYSDYVFHLLFNCKNRIKNERWK